MRIGKAKPVRRKKIAILAVCVGLPVALIVLAVLWAAGVISPDARYDYRKVKVNDSADYTYIQDSQKELERLLEPVEGCVSVLPTRQDSQQANLVLEDGIRVASIPNSTFISLLKDGRLAAVAPNYQRYFWYFPVKETAEGTQALCLYRSTELDDMGRPLPDGKILYSFWRIVPLCYDSEGGFLGFMFHPESLVGLLEERQVGDIQMLLPVHTFFYEGSYAYEMNVVYVESSTGNYVVPYGAYSLPHKLQEAQVYTVEEFLSVVEPMAQQPAQD